MEIINRKVIDLIPYDKNPRKNDEAVKYVKASIEQFGFKVPIVIDADGVIVAGHTRLKAAKELGMEEVPCIVADDLNEEQIKAFRLVDNKTAEMADWDIELLNTELLDLEANFDMADFGFEIEPPTGEVSDDDFDADAVADAIVEPVTKLGDIWQLGRHRLMCGDSTDRATVDRLMDGQKADMVFTDPPYGVAYTGNSNPNTQNIHNSGAAMEIKNDKLHGEDLKQLYQSSMANAHAVTTDKAVFYIWYATSRTLETLEGVQNAGIEVRAYIFWYKIESPMSAFMSQYIPNYEPLLYCYKKGSTTDWFGPTNEKCVWEQQAKLSDRVHPTEKPIELSARAIKNSSQQDGTVIDLFGGSGSTLIACEQLNRTCYMMELDPKYCDVIIKRWEALTGDKAVLLNG